MLLEPQMKWTPKPRYNEDIFVIILLLKNPSFKGFLHPFDIEIYGKKMWEYVKMACSDFRVKTTFCTPETNVVELIKPMLKNKKFTIVLYSDAPLITKTTLNDALNYMIEKQMNVLSLPRGYIFNTEYIKTQSEVQSGVVNQFNTEDFLTAVDFSSLEQISAVLKKRILNFHQKNGVFIADSASTFIDADVVLDAGVIIEPNNVIKGCSFIDRNCHLKSGNIIENSIIGENSTLCGAFISGVKLEAGSVVGAFEKIIG